MCGIAGIFNLKDSPPDLADLKLMASMLKHRGPDEYGIFIDNNAGIASSRLKIIDLTGGTQPLHNEDQTLWIVYNGEIFNYIELREDLRKRHRFYTETDTEVILHLYEEKKSQCLKYLNGEFAFAIYDTKNKELFFGRDRNGIRPLYYTVFQDQLLFASEIKAIFACKKVPRTLDPFALDQIFTFWTTIPGRSAFRDIREVPAGHYMKTEQGRLKISRYWDIPFTSPPELKKTSIKDFSSELYELLKDSVRIRLRADVPVGCYISGGLDSSGIVSLVKNNFNNKLMTFGIGFEDKSFDESEYQKEIIQFLNAGFSAVTASDKAIGELFPEVIWHTERPVLRTAPVPMYLLSKLVHQSGYKVVLTGEGADEVFGGYDIFREAKIRAFWSRRPDSVYRPLLLGKLYPYMADSKMQALLFQFYKKGIGQPDAPFFSHLIRWNNTARIKSFFSPAMREILYNYDCLEELETQLPADFQQRDYLSKAQYLETILFLNNYLLSSQGDRMAMASSVETRLPYLDFRLAELSATAPANLKIKGLQEKYILKKALGNTIPASISRRRKYPYRAPVKSGLLKGNPEIAAGLKNDAFFRKCEIFDSGRVMKLINKLSAHENGSELDNMALAGILSVKILHEKFIEDFNTKCSLQDVNLLYDRRSVAENV